MFNMLTDKDRATKANRNLTTIIYLIMEVEEIHNGLWVKLPKATKGYDII